MSDDVPIPSASTKGKKSGGSRPDFANDPMYSPLAAIFDVGSLADLNDATAYPLAAFKQKAAQHSKAAGREKKAGSFNSWTLILNELLSPPAATYEEEEAGAGGTGDAAAAATESQPASLPACQPDELVDEACALVEVLLSGRDLCELPPDMTDERYQRLVRGVEVRIAELEATAKVRFEELKANAETVGSVCEVVKVSTSIHMLVPMHPMHPASYTHYSLVVVCWCRPAGDLVQP